MSNYKMQNGDYSKLDKNMKVVFVTAEFNRDFTKALEDINEELLRVNGFNNVEKFLVPGAFEIPAFVKLVKQKLNPDLIICFGVVIRGETTHYEMVAGESARGIMNISIEDKNSTAYINGILTCENEEQVKARISPIYALSGLNLLAERKKVKNSKK
ncbi:MAG: 6,7-dimethyl-8-ribityllumazine synthase [Candidatus Gracilibacteria bacterium]|nr:6,7-dimethyl-8-ribityllumazine synthase [Candidatus Gracilibacteria bacterium]